MGRGNRTTAGRFLDFVPVFPTMAQGYVETTPSQGAAMNQTIEWIQGHWYELGSLIAQFALLFAGVWFAQKILKTMRASQQQFGALLRLSMCEGLEERQNESEATQATPSVVASAMLSPIIDRPTAPTHFSTSYAAFEKPSGSEAPSLTDELNARTEAKTPAPAMAPTSEPTDEPTPYVAAPLTLPADEQGGSRIAAAGRGVVQWLQTPVASEHSSSSPWRRVVRWLQIPVRS